MAKTKFICTACGFESGKWYGKCPSCSNWNTFDEVEVVDTKRLSKLSSLVNGQVKIEKAIDIKTFSKTRITSGFEEFDRVLGGGIVPGSVVLLSGDPGIGKSTILLQIALNISGSRPVSSSYPSVSTLERGKMHNDKSLKKGENQSLRTVFYITGEESSGQVKTRIDRIIHHDLLIKRELFVISETDIDRIIAILLKEKPDFIIVDSIQAMQTSNAPGFPGSIPQIRNTCMYLVSYAKNTNIPVFLIGHVTKEGIVAGPMLLSHMVDTVLYLEGEKFSGTRILRAYKNRFGNSEEVGIFMMEEKGLVQIKDASNFFIDKKEEPVPGSCTAVIMEGSRPLLIEIQALVVPSTLSFPRRVCAGFPEKRLELLLAVLQKHLRIPIDKMDVFLNVVGGFKIIETSSDLAACLAIVSSFKNKPLPGGAAISEVGLLGELRNVINLEKRISEARKFGYKNILTIRNHKTLNEVVRDVL